MKKKIVSCFDIGEVPRNPGKWNWNWLYFLPFIFTFKQGAYIHLGELGVERFQLCLQDTSRSTKWHRRAAVGQWVSLYVKCCRMVDSAPRSQLSLSWPIQSDHLLIADWMISPLGQEHSHEKTQYSRSWWGHDCEKQTNKGSWSMHSYRWFLACCHLVRVRTNTSAWVWNEGLVNFTLVILHLELHSLCF